MKEISKKRVLAIGAHPDDLEIGCGGTLLKMSEHSYTIRGLILSQGERGGDPVVRGNIAKETAKLMGMEELCILQFPDTHLLEALAAISQCIEKTIDEYNPALLVTHSPHDYHPDHVAVNSATLSAAREYSSILCFESPSSTGQYQPNLFVDVSEFIDSKLQVVSGHWAQSRKDYLSPRQILAKLIFRGSQARVQYAEGFEVVRLLSSSWGDV